MFRQCQSCALDLLRQQHMPAESREQSPRNPVSSGCGTTCWADTASAALGLSVLAEEPAQVEASAQVLPMPLNKGFSQKNKLLYASLGGTQKPLVPSRKGSLRSWQAQASAPSSE